MSIFGWIVMMSRYGLSADWALPWSSNRDGFRLNSTDFWLGLERVHLMTASTSYRLRFEMFIPYQSKNWRSVEYSSFTIGSEVDSYNLSIAG